MLKILFSLFMVLYAFYMPGYLLLKSGSSRAKHPVSYAAAFGLGVTLVPILSFGAAVLLGTIVQNILILIVATFINLICLLLISKRKRKPCTS
jgi:hypothetical protein